MKKKPQQTKKLLASFYLYVDLYMLKNGMGDEILGR